MMMMVVKPYKCQKQAGFKVVSNEFTYTNEPPHKDKHN